ncbi:MAG: hypothetical protein Q4E24_16310 [bacterium]|nr:hypothetical protein [bacterium]
MNKVYFLAIHTVEDTIEIHGIVEVLNSVHVSEILMKDENGKLIVDNSNLIFDKYKLHRILHDLTYKEKVTFVTSCASSLRQKLNKFYHINNYENIIGLDEKGIKIGDYIELCDFDIGPWQYNICEEVDMIMTLYKTKLCKTKEEQDNEKIN